MAHSFNLLAKRDTLKALNDSSYKTFYNGFFSKLNSLLKKQNYSAQKSDIIREFFNGHLFVIPGDTRWNGTYLSVKDFFKKIDEKTDENIINELMEKLELTCFKKRELEFGREFLKVMAPIARAIEEFQRDHNTGLGLVLPTLVSVKFRLDKIKAEKLKFCEILIKVILEGMEKRFENLFKNSYFVLAAISTPSLKLNWILDQESRNIAKDLLKKEVEKVQISKPKTEDLSKQLVI